MAPLSVLPGRVRFESQELLGNERGCMVLEEILSVHGVHEASASHRTGRVLIRFDEKVLSRPDVDNLLATALQAVATADHDQSAPAARRSAAPAGMSPSVGHLVRDMALHAILPGPLDLLLPFAATAFRR